MPVYRFGDMLVDPQKYPWGHSFLEWALSFGTTGSYVNLNTTSIISADGDFTIEAMVKLPHGDTKAFVGNNQSQSGRWNIEKRPSAQNYVLRFFADGLGDRVFDTANPIPDDVDTHIAVVRDGSTIKLYLDGSEDSEYTNQSGTLDTSEEIALGDAGVDRGVGADGLLRKVRMWDVARTQQELQDYKHKRLTGREVGLVGWWPFDEGQGDVLYDRSGNDNHGAIYGATWVRV